jgi:hypothetical protein
VCREVEGARSQVNGAERRAMGRRPMLLNASRWRGAKRKRGVGVGASTWRREKEKGGRQRGATSSGPRPSGARCIIAV